MWMPKEMLIILKIHKRAKMLKTLQRKVSNYNTNV